MSGESIMDWGRCYMQGLDFLLNKLSLKQCATLVLLFWKNHKPSNAIEYIAL